jgi:hypothetical protein
VRATVRTASSGNAIITYPTSASINEKQGAATVTFGMTDEDGQPITVKLSVRNAENPLWEAADKLKRLISDIEEVAMINASYQRAIAAE